MKPFLDCNVWAVVPWKNNPIWFYLIKIYPYNSLNENVNVLLEEFDGIEHVQVPEFLIEDLRLLNTVDPALMAECQVPVIRKYDSIKWKIDLEHYENAVDHLQQKGSRPINPTE